jgi:hypothetical protein
VAKLQQQKLSGAISEEEFECRRKEAAQNYTDNMESLRKTKHDIKKGYLKYIDCINKVKLIGDPKDAKHSNKYGLRKVSSESNFLSVLYEKIFRFDKCTSELSAGSESIEMLTKRILIRKEHGKWTERRSLSDVRSAARSSFEYLRSSKEVEGGGFENTQRLSHQLMPNMGHSGDGGSEVLKNEGESRDIREFQCSGEMHHWAENVERPKAEGEAKAVAR